MTNIESWAYFILRKHQVWKLTSRDVAISSQAQNVTQIVGKDSHPPNFLNALIYGRSQLYVHDEVFELADYHIHIRVEAMSDRTNLGIPALIGGITHHAVGVYWTVPSSSEWVHHSNHKAGALHPQSYLQLSLSIIGDSIPPFVVDGTVHPAESLRTQRQWFETTCMAFALDPIPRGWAFKFSL